MVFYTSSCGLFRRLQRRADGNGVGTLAATERVDDVGGGGRGTRAEFEHGDRINEFCVSRKNEDILGVRGGGEGQRNIKTLASNSVYLYKCIRIPIHACK